MGSHGHGHHDDAADDIQLPPGVAGPLGLARALRSGGTALRERQHAGEEAHHAEERHDEAAAQRARDTRNDATLEAAGAGAEAVESGTTLARTFAAARRGAEVLETPGLQRLERVGHRAGQAAAVIEGGRGLYRMGRGARDWRSGGDRAADDVSDGFLGVASSALTLGGGPAGRAAATGIGIGQAARAHADDYARQSGMFGRDTRQQGRGMSGRAQNMTATDRAVEDGLAVQRRVGAHHHRHLATAAGAITTIGMAPVRVGQALVQQGVSALDVRGPDSIIAADQEERGVPLDPHDHSAVAEHRRRIRAQREQQAAAQQAANAQSRAAMGDRDLTDTSRAGADAHFTPINGGDASIEQRALGWRPAPEFHLDP